MVSEGSGKIGKRLSELLFLDKKLNKSSKAVDICYNKSDNNIYAHESG